MAISKTVSELGAHRRRGEKIARMSSRSTSRGHADLHRLRRPPCRGHRLSMLRQALDAFRAPGRGGRGEHHSAGDVAIDTEFRSILRQLIPS